MAATVGTTRAGSVQSNSGKDLLPEKIEMVPARSGSTGFKVGMVTFSALLGVVAGGTIFAAGHPIAGVLAGVGLLAGGIALGNLGADSSKRSPVIGSVVAQGLNSQRSALEAAAGGVSELSNKASKSKLQNVVIYKADDGKFAAVKLASAGDQYRSINNNNHVISWVDEYNFRLRGKEDADFGEVLDFDPKAATGNLVDHNNTTVTLGKLVGTFDSPSAAFASRTSSELDDILSKKQLGFVVIRPRDTSGNTYLFEAVAVNAKAKRLSGNDVEIAIIHKTDEHDVTTSRERDTYYDTSKTRSVVVAIGGPYGNEGSVLRATNWTEPIRTTNWDLTNQLYDDVNNPRPTNSSGGGNDAINQYYGYRLQKEKINDFVNGAAALSELFSSAGEAAADGLVNWS